MRQPAAGERRAEATYEALLAEYGPQGWWPQPHGGGALEVCVGAMLVQHTTWSAAERALANLHAAGALSVDALHTLPLDDVGALLRPAGTYRAKAHRLRSLAAAVVAFGGSVERFLGGDVAAARARLLEVYGVGPETAETILLYAGERPTFVVDAYARRLFGRLGLPEPDRDWPADALDRDTGRLSEWHALIVEHGKRRCFKARPDCGACPLLPQCPTGAELVGSPEGRAPG